MREGRRREGWNKAEVELDKPESMRSRSPIAIPNLKSFMILFFYGLNRSAPQASTAAGSPHPEVKVMAKGAEM